MNTYAHWGAWNETSSSKRWKHQIVSGFRWCRVFLNKNKSSAVEQIYQDLWKTFSIIHYLGSFFQMIDIIIKVFLFIDTSYISSLEIKCKFSVFSFIITLTFFSLMWSMRILELSLKYSSTLKRWFCNECIINSVFFHLRLDRWREKLRMNRQS